MPTFTDPQVDLLMKRRADKLALIRTLTTAAAENERDLSEQDETMITAAKGIIASCDRQLALIGDNLEMDEEAQNRLARLQPGAIKPATHAYRDAGALMWDMLHRDEPEVDYRYRKYVARAAEHMGTTAANTTPVAGGFGGLWVASPAGPVLDFAPGTRPLLDAIGVIPAPAVSFLRPRIVDPDLDTGVGVQTLEKAELVSKKWDWATDQLTLKTTGGYINASEQLLEMIPGSLNMLVDHMNKRLARSEEFATVGEIAKTTATIPLAADASAGELIAAFFDASALVFTNTGELATWVAMGPLGWARLGSTVDAADRPLFPFLGAANAFGTMDATTFSMIGPAGLRPVVSYAIKDGAFYVGGPGSIEAYERRIPLMSAAEPSVLGRQIAVGAMMVFYRGTTKEAVTGGSPTPAENNTVVKLAP